MRKSASLLVLVVISVLGGCAAVDTRNGPPFTATHKECRAHDCDISLAIDNCVIKPEADVVDVIDGAPAVLSTRVIRWTIATPGYRFRDHPINYGIVIKDFDPTREFDNPVLGNDTFKINFRNKFKKPNGYEYGVNVVRSIDGTPCPTLDPWIVNH